jgi:hypothetical protein
VGSCIGPKCSARATARHHVVYKQELKRRWVSDIRQWIDDPAVVRVPWRKLRDLYDDERNLVPVCNRCHARTHSGVARLPLWVLPDSVYEFALELLGPGPAYEWLRRRYDGGDPRLDALLEAAI